MLVKTKFLGATHTKPARIKASTSFALSVTISYRYTDTCPSRTALAALIEKLVDDGVFLTEGERNTDMWRKEYFDGEYWFVSP